MPEPWGELFDLREDPEERKNLFGDPDCAGIQGELHARLLDELVATESPWPAGGS